MKYTPEGGHIWLRFIGLQAHSNALEHLRIEVEDEMCIRDRGTPIRLKFKKKD